MSIEQDILNNAVARLFELYGGKESFEKDMQRQEEEFNEKWNQNTELLGRILRAHLVVEHYLTKWLQYHNPNLGSIDDAKLTFENKFSLVSKNETLVKDMLPGIKRLNIIRNRIVHNLSVSILPGDEDALKSSKIFKAMIDLDYGLYCSPSASGIELLEGFAKYAAYMLDAISHENTNLWSEAFEYEAEAT